MKRRKTNNSQIRRVGIPSPERSDPGTAVTIRAREQVFNELAAKACELTGTHSSAVSDRIIYQIANAQVWPKPSNLDDDLISAMASIAEIAPQNLMQAMLAAQMIATHEAALRFFHRSTLEDQHTEVVEANALRASRLMRLFIQQAEAMQRLKGKAGQRNLTVEQVNVLDGGQAIVGSVNTSKSGG